MPTRDAFSNYRKLKRERMLRRLAAMRAEKERKRLANPPEHEPRMVRYHRFEFGVRDRITGEVAFTELRSVRQAATALGLILKHFP